MKDYATHTTRNDVGSRMDWVRVGVLAGFIATFAMTAVLAGAYLLADAFGDPNGGQLARWMENLSHNRIIDRVGDAFLIGLVLNLVIGVAWALIYGRFFEPRFDTSGISKGMLFALIPFVLSVAIVFPLMDAGFLGSGLGAGPLPFIGNLVAHLVYGAVLGFVYAIEEERGIPDSARDRQANATAEVGAAYGVVIGGVLGAIGGWLVAPTMDTLADRPVLTLAGVLTGAAIGTLIGSFAAMRTEDDEQESVHLPGARRHRA
jgi:MFS family permease